MVDIAIIGGGPAGITASIYAARAGFSPVIFEKTYVGGQLANTNEIDNYPGFKSVSGFDLIQKFDEHSKSFGIEVVLSEVTKISLSGNEKIITASGGEYKAKALIITAGAKPARLSVPGEDEFAGKGVSYCAVCDGAFYKNKTVCVVGGGNTAMHDAVFLSRFCEKVYIIHRRNEFRADLKEIEKMKGIANIIPLTGHVVNGIKGDGRVKSVIVTDSGGKDKKSESLDADGVFIAVGTSPGTDFLRDMPGLEFDNGAIITDVYMQTALPGVFAAGDARKTPLRQVVTAAADGAVAAHYAAAYLSERT